MATAGEGCVDGNPNIAHTESDDANPMVPVTNELLCFLQQKCNIMTFDDLVKVCSDFYTADEVDCTRMLLAKYVSGKRLGKPKGTDCDVAVKSVSAMLKILLDPSVKLPVFCAVNLSRLPPVDVEHVDISAVLQELSALRREVRMMNKLREEVDQLKGLLHNSLQEMAVLRTETRDAAALKEELAVVKAAVAELTLPPTPPSQPTSITKTAAMVLKDSIGAGRLSNATLKDDGTQSTRTPAPRRRPQPIVGSSSTNDHVKGVETMRTVEIFVSRLHPATARSELVDCVNKIKGDLVVHNILCEKLKVVHEHLYSSFRVAITVGTAAFHQAIGLFNTAEAWPNGVYIRRFYKPKNNKNESS